MKFEDRMSTKTRRQYTETFKAEAVRLVRDSARPVAQVARDLGIADHLLYRQRAAANRTLLATIRVLHQDSRQTYGSPGIWRALRKQGHRVGGTSRGPTDAPRWPPGQDREAMAGHDALVARLARSGEHAGPPVHSVAA